MGIVRTAAFMVVIGTVLNRVNTSMLTFNWKLDYREIPHWREVVICITIYAIYMVVYRFILYRLPILYKWKTADELAEAREGVMVTARDLEEEPLPETACAKENVTA
jgi:hypothetical protein